jgi:DNA polymerase I-like protein with 3'-5' exonuclease and polymerase domains
MLGRKRYLPAINHPVSEYKHAAGRQAVNTVVQGSASDLVSNEQEVA